MTGAFLLFKLKQIVKTKVVARFKKNVEFCDEKFFTNGKKCIMIITRIELEFKKLIH